MGLWKSGRRWRRCLGMFALAGLLCSCEAWKERMRFWNSPQGQLANAQMIGQMNQQMHEQWMAQQQAQQQAQLQLMQQRSEALLRMTPVKVQHSGSINVNYSGTINHRHSGAVQLWR